MTSFFLRALRTLLPLAALFALCLPPSALAHPRQVVAARSFSISVENWTGTDWHRGAVGLAHGIWSNNSADVPPEVLPKVFLDANGDAQPGRAFFASESNGVLTGTEGFVDYSSPAGVIHIYWDNPYVGGNQFHADMPNGFVGSWGDPGGNDAHIDLGIKRD